MKSLKFAAETLNRFDGGEADCQPRALMTMLSLALSHKAEGVVEF